jgi:hypothetical protein
MPKDASGMPIFLLSRGSELGRTTICGTVTAKTQPESGTRIDTPEPPQGSDTSYDAQTLGRTDA